MADAAQIISFAGAGAVIPAGFALNALDLPIADDPREVYANDAASRAAMLAACAGDVAQFADDGTGTKKTTANAAHRILFAAGGLSGDCRIEFTPYLTANYWLYHRVIFRDNGVGVTGDCWRKTSALPASRLYLNAIAQSTAAMIATEGNDWALNDCAVVVEKTGNVVTFREVCPSLMDIRIYTFEHESIVWTGAGPIGLGVYYQNSGWSYVGVWMRRSGTCVTDALTVSAAWASLDDIVANGTKGALLGLQIAPGPAYAVWSDVTPTNVVALGLIAGDTYKLRVAPDNGDDKKRRDEMISLIAVGTLAASLEPDAPLNPAILSAPDRPRGVGIV